MIRKGSYILMMHLQNDSDIEIGALGHMFFPAGHYCYVGSARNGLDQRIRRHMSKDKKIHWHIDRLTMISKEMRAFESFSLTECELGCLVSEAGGSPVMNGFGCSDCRCGTHLFRVDPNVIEKAILDAGLVAHAHT